MCCSMYVVLNGLIKAAHYTGRYTGKDLVIEELLVTHICSQALCVNGCILVDIEYSIAISSLSIVQYVASPGPLVPC